MPLDRKIQDEYKQEIFKALDAGQIAGSVGQIVGAVVGAIIGFVVGGIPGAISGAMIGYSFGGAIGGIADAPEASEPTFGYQGGGGAESNSARYGFGALSNTATNEATVPVLYGALKVAGNIVYQSDPGEIIYRCVAISEGEIQQITDVKANDKVLNTLSGCSYTAYLGTSSQSVDSRFSSAVYGLRYLAYIAITLKASDQLKGGNPTITCEAQGVKVSTWNGSSWTVTKTFSRNPVACLRDLLTNSRYGGGLSEASIDAASWGSAYEYCNETLEDITGASTEVRAYLDYVVDGKRPILDAINSILATFNGFLVFSGSKIKLKIEKSESVSQAFNMSNIVKGSFTYLKISKDSLPNRVKVQYIDPVYNYTKIFAQADDPVDQENRRALQLGEDIVTQEVSLLGITRYSQAARQAKIFLHFAQACSTYCTFSVSSDSLAIEVGDVAYVTHDVPRWTLKKFRVLSIEATKDDNLKLSCRAYDSSIYDGYASGGIAPDYGDVTGLYTEPNEPRNFTVTQDLAGVQFAWTVPISKFDVTIGSFEIRRGSNWDTATVITSTIDSDEVSYTSTNEFIGTAVYLMKSYSTYGIYSILAAKDCISSTMPAPYDPVYEYDEFTRLGGALTDGLRREWTADFDSSYFRKVIAVDNSTAQHQWDETSEVWDNSNIVYDEGPYEAGQQTYTCEEIDLGADFTANMEVDYDTTAGAVSIEWRYKKDGDAYGAYAVFYESTYTFRYCQFRIKMTTASVFYTMKLTKFKVSAFIADVTESGSVSITNANNGQYVSFTKTFAVNPKVVLFTDGMSDYEPRISNISTLGFTAKLYDVDNNIYKTGDLSYFIANY